MSLVTLPSMYGYQIAGEAPRERGVLFDYVLAGNGLFVRGAREGLSVCFPVSNFEVRGLPELSASFELKHERVPLHQAQAMVGMSTHFAERGLETLFHFTLDDQGHWRLHNPEQMRKPSSCRPMHDGPGSTYERAFIEAHSHHSMRAYFSSVDNRDETGFRIYAVMGELFKEPRIRVRVGVYGHFWEIPAEWVFELPEGLSDCLEIQ